MGKDSESRAHCQKNRAKSARAHAKTTKRGGLEVTTLYRIKNMEASPPTGQFMRVHRSYIVNLRHIRSYVRGRVYLNNDAHIPIGENYKEAFQQYIERTFKPL